MRTRASEPNNTWTAPPSAVQRRSNPLWLCLLLYTGLRPRLRCARPEGDRPSDAELHEICDHQQLHQAMNWAWLRPAPWLDTRARFVSRVPRGGTLLDLGSSDGETLRHIAELRPDLKLLATDIDGAPERYPNDCEFARANLETDRLPWPEQSVDAITCMHLVEHLHSLEHLFREISRLLKPQALVYFETPHPETVGLPCVGHDRAIPFTLNFYDDPTHIRPVPVEELKRCITPAGLQPVRDGTSRNWLFALSHPVYACLPPSRKKYTAQAHWLGWSAYLIGRKEA